MLQAFLWLAGAVAYEGCFSFQDEQVWRVEGTTVPAALRLSGAKLMLKLAVLTDEQDE